MIRRIFFVLMLVVAALAFFTTRHSASAISGANWRSGRIIDDYIFTNKADMSVDQIQQFLNSMVGTGPNGRVAGQCDTNGVGISELGGGTRAQYGAAHGNPAPFTCLKDYYEVPKTSPGPGIPASNYGGQPIPGGAESAAQLIWDAAQRYSINPKVLLVMIQKESAGPLITDDWPFQSQYTYAMGAHCPDTSGCDPNYAGFSIQISESAALMRYYLDNMSQPWWPYKKLGNNNVLYNPDAACGSSNVYIESSATAALYTYTPYQPNAGALAGLNDNTPGGTAPCGAYGNRNFWWYFNKWFGSTLVSNLPGCDEATNTTRSCIWNLSSPGNSSQFLTSSIQTRDSLFAIQGYQYGGKWFFGNVIPLTGNIPIYRASVSGGGSFLTANLAEYNNLVAGGYTGNGVDFYADPAGSNSGFPVYRLYNPTSFQHYWTTDLQQLQTMSQSGWNYEGIAFTSISPVKQEVAPPAGKMLVYRFYIPQSHSHFWTTDVYERDTMIKSGYQYEGVAWYSSANSADKPVYRLYAPAILQHLYTTDTYEKDTLVASGKWINEGINQYVSQVSNSNPIYRVYAPSLGVHLLTSDAYEKSVLVSSGRWNDEGIAWYQP